MRNLITPQIYGIRQAASLDKSGREDCSEAWGCELQYAFQIPYIAFEVRQAFQLASRKIGFELHGELLFQTACQAVSYTCSVLGSCAVK